MYTYNLKTPSTPLNGSSGSVISGITTPFSLPNIDQNDSSVKNTQFQSSELFPDNYIDIEGTNLMLNFDNNLLNNNTLKPTTTCQCSTSKTVSSYIYFTSISIHTDTTSDSFSNTSYELDVTSTYNEWEYYERKYGGYSLNGQHNRSTKQTLKVTCAKIE